MKSESEAVNPITNLELSKSALFNIPLSPSFTVRNTNLENASVRQTKRKLREAHRNILSIERLLLKDQKLKEEGLALSKSSN